MIVSEFNRDEYRKYLREIADSNPGRAGELISLLALRAAARSLLFAFTQELFDWISSRKGSQIIRLAELLGIYGILNGRSVENAEISACDYYSVARNMGRDYSTAKYAPSLMSIYSCSYASAACAYSDDTNVTIGYALAAVSASIIHPSLLDEAFQDFQGLIESRDMLTLFKTRLLRKPPEFLSQGLVRLEHLLAQTPRVGGEENNLREQVDIILDFLWHEFGLSRPERAGKEAEYNRVSKGSSDALSFLSTNQFHPESPSATDKLNRQKLVNALAVNLTHSTNKHHRAIGLLGEWGSGKSTVLDLLKQRLKELSSEQPYIFGDFNAWAYEHTDNIQAGVAQEMINALTGSPDALQPLYPPTASFFEKLKKVLSSDVRKIFAVILNAIPVSSNMSLRWFSERCALTIRFAYKVHPVELLKILLLLLVAAMPWFSEWFQELIEFSESSNKRNSWIWTGGVFLYTLREFGKLIISPQAKELLTYLRLPSYAEHLGTIPVMRKHICTLCNLRLKQKNGKTPRLLFVVDDLDRCSPSAIVKVLEAVRLVLDLDNVIVIIAIDQHIALAALSEHFKDFSPHHKLKNSHAIAREYLSKVINLPIVLTKPSSDDVRMFMGSFWEEMNKTVEREVNESKSKLETSDISNVSENSGVSTAGDDRLDGRDITQHASAEGNRVPGTLGTDTVDLDGSEQSNAEVEPPLMMKPVKALSKDQQESFIYWVNYFELSNSRQLKRLNNSYDLMRSYVPLMDKEVFEFEFAESAVSKVYPMLLTLILMEYLNSLHDLKERNQLWDQLFRESTPLHSDVVGNRLVSTDFIKAYRHLLAAEGNQTLVSSVEAFVLPAMN